MHMSRVHGRGQAQIHCCGSNITINEAKRIPSPKANHCNKIFVWINTFCFIYLWILFPEFLSSTSSAINYCNDAYSEVVEDTNSYDTCLNTDGCNNDDSCVVISDWYVDSNIMCASYDSSGYSYYYDCECCASALFLVIAIIFYVLLGINTLRTVVCTLLCGMCKVDRKQTYELNHDTGHVKLKPYMDYICDTPAMMLITICYSDVRRAMNEAIAYGITFPTTKFLVHNILVQNVPIGVLCGYFVFNNGWSYDQNFMFILEIIFAGVGFLANIFRWQQINRIEKYNMLQATTV